MKILSPQAEMEAKGDESELHVIILDEVTPRTCVGSNLSQLPLK